MSIMTKVVSSVVIIVVGAIIAGVIRDIVGAGQYIASGVIVLLLFYVWGRPIPSEESIKEKEKG